MRFLLLNTDYRAFVEQMYERQPGLTDAPYEEQLKARNATFFGVGDAYTRALVSRGHEAHDIHMNNPTMQAAWVRENGPIELGRRIRSRRIRMRRGIVPWLSRSPDDNMLLDVLAAQVAHHRPDVVLNHDISWMSPEVLRRIVGPEALLIGQHAAPPYPAADYAAYDLIVSSWPPTIERMRAAGVRTEHLGLGFDPAVLPRIGPTQRDLPVTFVGSLSTLHAARTSLLETLCAAIPDMHVFAPSIRSLPRTSAIHRSYRGPAYGLDMFRVLARSEATINHHGFPEPHANNMRLFEATGVGTLLLTDRKPDLSRYFGVGTEVLTYGSAEECVSLVGGLTPAARHTIASAGERRTLETHTWDHRIGELLALLS